MSPSEIYALNRPKLDELSQVVSVSVLEEGQARTALDAANAVQAQIFTETDDRLSEAYRTAQGAAERAQAEWWHADARQRQAVTAERSGYQLVQEAVHNQVTDETDPMEYLFTIAELVAMGRSEAVHNRSEVERSHDTLRRTVQPVAILGAADAVLAVGLSQGGYHVRRPAHEDKSMGGDSAAVLGLPLARLHLYGMASYDGGHTAPFEHGLSIFEAAPNDPFLVRIMQRITDIRTTDTPAGVEQAIHDANHGDKTISTNHGSVLGRTYQIAGMMPVIAYGHRAVSSLIQSIAERNRRIPQPLLRQGDLYALAVNLGVKIPHLRDPNSVAYTQLRDSFVRSVGILIRDQVEVTLAGMLGSKQLFASSYWPAAATADVMRFVGADKEMAGIARDHLQPLFAEASNASDQGRLRTAERVAGALRESFAVTIDANLLVENQPLTVKTYRDLL